MKLAIAYGLIGLGMALLLGSAAWSSMRPGTSAWTAEKDVRLSETGNKMHVLRFKIGNAEANPSMHGGPDLIQAKAELDSLMTENKVLYDEFKGVQAKPHTISRIMKWSGITLAALGLIGWYAVKES